MGDGKKVKLRDVAHLGGGYAFKSTQYTDAGRFVLRTVNIRDDTSITKEGAMFILEEEAAQLERFFLKEHDTLFVMVAATLGKIGYVRASDLPALLNQNMWIIRAKDDLIDPVYLHYLFRELSKIPLAWVGGSARSFLRRDDVRNLEFDLPHRSTQKGIAEILKAFDDKIELNRRMNETLEAMARAIFKDWFVDFGPTRAKAEGRAPYLAPELWDLFPAVLDDEDKPVGWKRWTLGDLAVHHRATVSPGADPDRTFEHYSLPAYDSGQEPVFDIGASIKSNKTVVPVGAVLLSKLNPDIPRVWIPNSYADACQIASIEFLAFTPTPEASRSLLYSLFRAAGFRNEMEAMVTGTSKSHQRVPPKALIQREVLLGVPTTFRAFDAQISLVFDRVLKNRAESRTLAKTRDLLLPKLMSGEIRLAEAEKAVEAVA